jgi:hypothetical protein
MNHCYLNSVPVSIIADFQTFSSYLVSQLACTALAFSMLQFIPCSKLDFSGSAEDRKLKKYSLVCNAR